METGAGPNNLGGGVNFNLLPGAMVELSGGEPVSVTTEAGVSAAREALDTADFSKLEGLMGAQGYKLEAGVFVPSDEYGQKAQGLDMGPDVGGEMTVVSKELNDEVFDGKAYNNNTTEKNTPTVLASASGQAASNAGKAYAENPTDENRAAFVKALDACASDHSEMNIYELLFICFRESIAETNKDKAYFLKKIGDSNNMAEGLSKYLEELVGKSQELSDKGIGDDGKVKEEAHKETVEVDIQRFDLSGPGKDGEIQKLKGASETKELDRAGLNDEMKHVESMQETIRNKRQMASTSFQNFDQKANQLYNLMSSVLKSVNEMRSGTVRNML
jgi:hypothetical protein